MFNIDDSPKKVELNCLANGGQPEPKVEFDGAFYCCCCCDVFVLVAVVQIFVSGNFLIPTFAIFVA